MRSEQLHGSHLITLEKVRESRFFQEFYLFLLHSVFVGNNEYRADAAIWSFREANRLATVNWSRGRTFIEPAVQEFEDKAFAELPSVEKRVTELVKDGRNDEAKKYVTSYTNSFAGAAMSRWQELKITLWGMFGRGF